MQHEIAREITRDGHVIIRDARCRFVFRRLRARVVEVQVIGSDNGQFGTAIIDEIALALFREGSLKLFVDASEGSMMHTAVTRAWAHFFDVNRAGLERVTILASSRVAAVAMALVRHFSNTGDLIQILSDREPYEARKGLATSTP